MHCTLGGNGLFLEGSTIRLIFMPWPFSLVGLLTILVEKGGKVMGLVVLTVFL